MAPQKVRKIPTDTKTYFSPLLVSKFTMADTPGGGGLSRALHAFSEHGVGSLHPMISPIIVPTVRVRPREPRVPTSPNLLPSPLSPILTPSTSPVELSFPIYSYVAAQIHREMSHATGISSGVSSSMITHTVSFVHDERLWSSEIQLPSNSSLSDLTARVLLGLFPHGVPADMVFGHEPFDFYFVWKDSVDGTTLDSHTILNQSRSLTGELHLHLERS